MITAARQRTAETFLQTHTGLFFCAACLPREVGVTMRQGRTLMWRLHALPEFEMRGAECANCSHTKRCIRHVTSMLA